MQLLTNLSFLLTKPTGTTTYALNLLPHLQPLNSILLTSQSFPDYNCYQTPTSTAGRKSKVKSQKSKVKTNIQ